MSIPLSNGYHFSGSDPIDWPPFRFETIRKFLAASAHQFGIAGALLQPAEYQIMAGLPVGDIFMPPLAPGVAPIFPLQNTGEAIGEYSQRINIFKEIRRSYEETKKTHEDDTSLVKLHHGMLIDALGTAPKLLVTGANRLHATVAEIFLILDRAYGAVSPTDVYKLFDRLSLPFDESSQFRNWCSQNVALHDLIFLHTGEFSSFHKIMYMRKAIAHVPYLVSEDGLYARDNPDIGDQNYAELVIQLQAAVDRQPVIATSKSMGYAAAASAEQTYGPKNWTKAQVLAHCKPDPSHNQYCFTHGTHCSHSSDKCLVKAQGHISTATAANKGNGSTERFKSRQQRAAEDLVTQYKLK